MTPAQQARERVKIAQLVLEEIEQEWIVPQHGTYLYFEGMPKLHRLGPRKTMQAVLSDKECQACAIGALFVAAVDEYDSLPAKEGVDVRRMLDYLGRWFEHSQLKLMEAAFENFHSYGSKTQRFHEKHSKVRGYDQITSFERARRSAHNVLVAIMKNVIKNKGRFVP